MDFRLVLALVFAITLHASSMALPSVNDLDRLKAGNATDSTSTDYGNEERGMAGVETVAGAGNKRIMGFKGSQRWDKFLDQIMPTLKYNRDRVSRLITFIKNFFRGKSKKAEALKKTSSVKTVEAKPDPPPVVPVPPKNHLAPESVPASASTPASASASTPASASASTPASASASTPASASAVRRTAISTRCAIESPDHRTT